MSSAEGQQSYTVTHQAQPPASSETYVGQIILSCFSFWCCLGLFGGVGFVLAMLAYDSAKHGDREKGDKLGKISYIMSAVGIVIGVILFGVIIGLQVAAARAK